MRGSKPKGTIKQLILHRGSHKTHIYDFKKALKDKVIKSNKNSYQTKQRNPKSHSACDYTVFCDMAFVYNRWHNLKLSRWQIASDKCKQFKVKMLHCWNSYVKWLMNPRVLRNIKVIHVYMFSCCKLKSNNKLSKAYHYMVQDQ